MKTKDLIVLERYYHRQADAWLILAQTQKSEAHGLQLAAYVTGWVPRLAADQAYDVTRFLDQEAAAAQFGESCNDGSQPEDPVFLQDLQRKQVYAWEANFPPDEDADLPDIASVKSLIRKVSHDYGIRTPRLILNDDIRSAYDPGDNTLSLRGLKLLTVLHEMAHAIHVQNCDDEEGGPEHGPGFVWVAVELYSRYGGMDLGYLFHTAMKKDLLGDLAGDQNFFNIRPAAAERKTPKPASPAPG